MCFLIIYVFFSISILLYSYNINVYQELKARTKLCIFFKVDRARKMQKKKKVLSHHLKWKGVKWEDAGVDRQ